jgi:lysophospholipase L1-like esterase
MPTLNALSKATQTITAPGDFVRVFASNPGDAMRVTWSGPGGNNGQIEVRNTTTSGQDVGPFIDGTEVTFLALSGSPSYDGAYVNQLPSLVSGAGIGYPAAIMGDSISAMSFVMSYSNGNADPVDNGDGTATVTFTANHSFPVGSSIRMELCSQRKFNQRRATVVAVPNAASVTYTITGATSPVIGNSPQAIYAWRTACSGWWGHLQAKTKNAFQLVANVTNWGAYSNELPELWASDVVAAGVRPKIVFYLCGFNDANSGPATLAQMQARALANFDLISGIGAAGHLITIPPYTNAVATSAMKVMRSYNAWLMQEAARRGWRCTDVTRAWAGTQGYISTFTTPFSVNPGAVTDEIHTSPLGAQFIGNAVAADLASDVLAYSRKYPLPFPDSTDGTGNLLANSPFTGSGGSSAGTVGTVSGTIPNNLTIQSDTSGNNVAVLPVARTLAADGDTYGNNLRLTITHAATGFVIVNFDATAAIPGGNSITYWTGASVAAGHSFSLLEVTARVNNGGASSPSAFTPQSLSGGVKPMAGAIDYLIGQDPVVIPASAGFVPSSTQLRMAFAVIGAGTSVITIKQPYLGQGQ